MQELLTLEKLQSMESQIFIRGYGLIPHPWFNNARNIDDFKLTPIKFVAVRGEIPDWAIYHSMDSNLCKVDYFNSYEHLYASWDEIYRVGSKLHDEKIIRQLVPCNDEAFNLYRH
jgi:hypothetical protein